MFFEGLNAHLNSHANILTLSIPLGEKLRSPLFSLSGLDCIVTLICQTLLCDSQKSEHVLDG